MKNTNPPACHRLAEALTAYLDQTLSAPERQSFQEHLAACAHCTEAVARAQALQRLQQKEGYLKPPEEAYRNVLRQLRQESLPPSPAFGWIYKAAGAFAVMAIVVITTRQIPRRPAPEPPPPAAVPVVIPTPAPSPMVHRHPAPNPTLVTPPAAEPPVVLPPTIAEAPGETPATPTVQPEETVQLPVKIVRSRREWESLWNAGQPHANQFARVWQNSRRWLEEKGVPKIGVPEASGIRTPEDLPDAARLPKPPRINFKENMVVALPSEAGHSAEITRVVMESGQIVVFYRSCMSGSACGATGDAPFSYGVIPKSDLPIVFKHH